jgi:hypothetical protein
VTRFSLILLLLFPVQHPQQNRAARTKVSTSPAAKILTVPFCELVRNPARYDQLVVRTTALYRFGGEELSELYSPACQTKDSLERRAAVGREDSYETLRQGFLSRF